MPNVPSGECSLQRILDVDDVEATNVLLTVNDHASPAHVATTGDDDDVTGIELDEVCDLVLLDIKFDGVVGLDARVWVADSPAVVGDDVGDALGTNSQFSDLEELVAGFLRGDAVDGETTLDIVKKAEVLAGLFNGDYI